VSSVQGLYVVLHYYLLIFVIQSDFKLYSLVIANAINLHLMAIKFFGFFLNTIYFFSLAAACGMVVIGNNARY